MDCTRVEKLLPLYAGGDLTNARERERVAAHLRGCDRCRALADEWAATQGLLRRHEPPEFDAAFFDGIRSSVMRKIGESPAPSPFAQLLALSSNPRAMAYAASVLLLVAAGALAFNLYLKDQSSGANAGNGDVAVRTEGSAGRLTPGPSLSPKTSDAKIETAPKTFPTQSRKRTGGLSARFNSRSEKGPAGSESASGSKMNEQVAALSRSEGAGGREINRDGLPAVASPTTVPGEAQAMLRIELQTKDPNVRIIWLSPQAGGQALAGKEADKR